MRAVLIALVLGGLAGAEEAPRCDRSAIRWEFPDSFEAARQRAADENRILLIKGVSFGIDDEGARCATKGRW